jgi:hypothetical protein
MLNFDFKNINEKSFLDVSMINQSEIEINQEIESQINHLLKGISCSEQKMSLILP